MGLAKAGSMQRPKMTDAIVEAIKVCGNSKGLASASSIRAMIMTDHPDLPKMVLKKAMTKAIEQGMVTQVKGNGFSGSFKLGKGKPAVKKAADGKKGAKKARSDRQPLEEVVELLRFRDFKGQFSTNMHQGHPLPPFTPSSVCRICCFSLVYRLYCYRESETISHV